MSLLTIISDMRQRLGLGQTTQVIGAADSTGIPQMLALLQNLGDELVERAFWQTLNQEGTFTGDGITATFDFPKGCGLDKDSYAQLSPGLDFISSAYPTMQVLGPVSNEQMARLKAFPAAVYPSVWRVIGDQFEFYPVLSLNEVMTFNYYSRNWITSGTAQSPNRIARWASDKDTALIDENMLSNGLEWRWLAAKGLDYAEAFRRFEKSFDRAEGRQATGRVIEMASPVMDEKPPYLGTITVVS
jgi:hypothetical protein